MRRGVWLPIAVTVGFMLAAPLALAAEETAPPQQATEQAQQPATPEAPAPQAPAAPAQAGEQPPQPVTPEAPAAQEAPQLQQPAEQTQQPATPEAPAPQAPAAPAQAGEQPPSSGELLHPGIGERKQGEASLGAPPAAAGPLPTAVECSNTPPPPEPEKPKKLNPCMGNEEAIKNGRQLFWRTGCEACHGPTGGGAMPGAPKLYDREWKFGGDDEAVFKLIKGQMPGMTMPPVFGLILNDMQIWNIISWIRTLYNDDPEFIVW